MGKIADLRCDLFELTRRVSCLEDEVENLSTGSISGLKSAISELQSANADLERNLESVTKELEKAKETVLFSQTSFAKLFQAVLEDFPDWSKKWRFAPVIEKDRQEEHTVICSLCTMQSEINFSHKIESYTWETGKDPTAREEGWTVSRFYRDAFPAKCHIWVCPKCTAVEASRQ